MRLWIDVLNAVCCVEKPRGWRDIFESVISQKQCQHRTRLSDSGIIVWQLQWPGAGRRLHKDQKTLFGSESCASPKESEVLIERW